MELFNVDTIIKILTDTASSREKDQFNTWLNQSVENQAYFQQMSDIFQKAQQTDKYSRIDIESAWTKIIQKADIPKRTEKVSKSIIKLNFIKKALKYAAILVLVYALGGLSYYFIKDNTTTEVIAGLYHTVTAPLGSKSKVDLPDGTTVWLNSGSEIRYSSNFSGEKRKIFLDGEAYFDVRKSKKHPFFVQTNDVQVKVLGTRFNVKSYNEEGIVETTLEEGIINISKAGSKRELQLKPKQKALFIKKRGDIKNPNPRLDKIRKQKTGNRQEEFIVFNIDDTGFSTSWKDNKLKFRSETFESLAVKLERWHNVKIDIEDDKLKSKVFTGSFQDESLGQIFEALQHTLNFHYKIEKNTVRIF